MNIRVPASGNAAKIAKAFLKSLGIEVKHAQALELVARLHGYKDNQAMQADVKFSDPMALAVESSSDFEFKGPRNSSVWITVENISVYIKRADEGVIVDLFKKGSEFEESLAGTYLEYNEAMDFCEACGGDLEDGFCTDLTCFHSDWPQQCTREDVESMTTEAIQAKYGVVKRDASAELSKLRDHVVQREGDDAGWWWHESADTDLVSSLAGAQGINFDGPYESEEAAIAAYANRLKTSAATPLGRFSRDSFTASNEIKARYLATSCPRHDVDEALQALRMHCSDIFENDTGMWEFLTEETHEDNEPSTVEVDWAVVAEEEDICALAFDKNNAREIVYVDPEALKELAEIRDLSNRLSLGRRSAYQYTVAEAGGAVQSIELRYLQGAQEHKPGYIDLKDGRVLQLLKQTEQGQYLRFSPALNDYVSE